MTVLNAYLLVIAVTAVLATWTSAWLHAQTPWRSTVVGVHLFWFTVALGTTFTALTLGLMIHDRPVWFDVVRALLYTSTPAVVIWRVVLQVRARHHSLLLKGDTTDGHD